MLLERIGTGTCRLFIPAGVLISVFLGPAEGNPLHIARSAEGGDGYDDPFAVLDPQNWVNPANMTWDDWSAPPGTDWANPARKGSVRNFNIALIVVDYDDKPFTITQPALSSIYGNPQTNAGSVSRDDVPAFYRDFLNTPGTLNHGHTLHEYWMGDSGGRFGVDLTAFGPYRLPSLSYQYGVDDAEDGMNPGACPIAGTCNVDLRTDALGAWRESVGNATAASYELVFILSAGQDESSTWQEFGEMRFQTKEDVPENFGPPGNETLPNYAHTRYVDWTSWAASSNIWPNAGDGSSTQAESSGMATYAHELSHLLNIGDNYNNPYGVPLRRAYTGPWSMLDRGSFNGPGGPHTRWEIPATQGGSMGSLHTMHDKYHLGLVSNSSIIQISRKALASSGILVASIIARAVDPGNDGHMGLRITLDTDRSPFCNISTDVYCDGGGYNNYELEVVDRIGADSFTPDSGVMISKTKDNVNVGPFQWTIDANPQDIKILDFYRPDGSPAMITLGDYRQLLDALFHAGTGSGSEYEYIDEANRLHFYIIDRKRDKTGVLSYTVAARSLDSNGGPSKHGVAISPGIVSSGRHNSPTDGGVTCSFELKNSGSYKSGSSGVEDYLTSDIYRLTAEVIGHGWHVWLPNILITAKFDTKVIAHVAVAADSDAVPAGIIKLTAISESNSAVVATAHCLVSKF